ncbi:TetR/AcrR family transcriptional regulator [Nocardioides speluncae]|uniref:TetR/AcrR family transcriptional regulator n=1 Tax=Nocardioides speluncae TaxID=2670337 RepID=UPI001F0C8320|nr:TetR family transcriptional regulator [Nocardioides speluncae]
MPPEPVTRSPKAEQTRQNIVDTAMRLFRAGGYDRTTMRAIADEAGVSIGNAYYYFSSKEHLIQAFYDRMARDVATEAESVLDRETEFAERLSGVLQTWVTVAEPYHEFAGKFFKNAAEPQSPLSPFSPESQQARDDAIQMFRKVMDGSSIKLNPGLRAAMPELLWLLHMGVVLFWVYDDSEDQRRTRTLIDKAVPLVDRTARLTRLPLVRGLVDDMLDLINSLKR